MSLQKFLLFILILSLSLPLALAAADDQPVTQCNDGIDNDGDGFADLNDVGCSSAADLFEVNPVCTYGGEISLVRSEVLDATSSEFAVPDGNVANGQYMPAGKYITQISGGAYSRWADDATDTTIYGGGPGLTWGTTVNTVYYNNGVERIRYGLSFSSTKDRAEQEGLGLTSGEFTHTGGQMYVYIDDEPITDNRDAVHVEVYKCADVVVGELFNPSFERGFGTDAEAWSEGGCTAEDSGCFERVAEQATDGIQSMRFSGTTEGSGFAADSILINLAPGEYRLEADFYHTLNEGEAYIGVEKEGFTELKCRSPVWSDCEIGWGNCFPAQEQHTVACEFNVEDSSENVFVRTIVDGFADGDVWFDNLRFTQITDSQIMCGNGAVEVGEQCDDGNTNSGDGCSSLCLVEEVVGPQSNLEIISFFANPDPTVAGELFTADVILRNVGDIGEAAIIYVTIPALDATGAVATTIPVGADAGAWVFFTPDVCTPAGTYEMVTNVTSAITNVSEQASSSVTILANDACDNNNNAQVEIIDFIANPNPTVAGDLFTIDLILRNSGTTNELVETVVTVPDLGIIGGTITTVNSGEDAGAWIFFTPDVCTNAGTYNMFATATYANGSKTDTAQSTVTILANNNCNNGSNAQIDIIEFVANPNPTTAGEQFTIDLLLRNSGDTNELVQTTVTVPDLNLIGGVVSTINSGEDAGAWVFFTPDVCTPAGTYDMFATATYADGTRTSSAQSTVTILANNDCTDINVICEANSVRGDLNGDGVVNSVDANILSDYFLGNVNVTFSDNICCVDINVDNEITLDDHAIIAQSITEGVSLGTCNAPTPQCSDGIDNDNDNAVDFPADIGCENVLDDDETNDNSTLADLDVTEFFVDPASIVSGDFFNAHFTVENVGSTDEQNVLIQVEAPQLNMDRQITVDINEGDMFSGWLSFSTPTCVASGNFDVNLSVTYNNAQSVEYNGTQIFIARDPACDNGGPVVLSCNDNSLRGDVNNDGVVNALDVQLAFEFISGNSSVTFSGTNFCCINIDANGVIDQTDVNDIANAANGLVDLGTCQMPTPQCINGLDDDNDNAVDFPADIGCEDRYDDNETNPTGGPVNETASFTISVLDGATLIPATTAQVDAPQGTFITLNPSDVLALNVGVNPFTFNTIYEASAEVNDSYDVSSVEIYAAEALRDCANQDLTSCTFNTPLGMTECFMIDGSSDEVFACTQGAVQYTYIRSGTLNLFGMGLAATFVPPEPENVTLSCNTNSIRGDVNGDGLATDLDAQLLQRFLNGDELVSFDFTGGICCADINVDNALSSADTQLIYDAVDQNVDLGTCQMPAPQCTDGVDNDGDGQIDYPNDPDCETPFDDNEDPSVVVTADPLPPAYANEQWVYDLASSSTDGSVQFRLEEFPRGMKINPETGRITWIPQERFEGETFRVVVSATNDLNSVLETFNLRVRDRRDRMGDSRNALHIRNMGGNVYAEAGSQAILSLDLGNGAGKRLSHITITAVVPELGIYRRIGEFDLSSGERKAKNVVLDIPEGAPAGWYPLRVVIHDSKDDYRRIKHRHLIIEE